MLFIAVLILFLFSGSLELTSSVLIKLLALISLVVIKARDLPPSPSSIWYQSKTQSTGRTGWRLLFKKKGKKKEKKREVWLVQMLSYSLQDWAWTCKRQGWLEMTLSLINNVIILRAKHQPKWKKKLFIFDFSETKYGHLLRRFHDKGLLWLKINKK